MQEDLKTAYLACNFDDRIEIWPLCATAFPAWGIIPATVEVLVGHFRLRFEKQTKNADERGSGRLEADSSLSAQASPIASDVELTLAWEEQSVTKVIARSVTILGSQHPSVWRTRGRQMRPCDHAIVCEGNRVWLVDLNPLKNRLKNPAVYELLKNGEYYQVGDMRLSLGPAKVECKASIEFRRERQPQAIYASPLHQGGSKSAIMVETLPMAKMLISFLNRQQAIRQLVCLAIQAKNRYLGGPPNTLGVLGDAECPEMLTSRLTGRLMSISQSRFTRGKLTRITTSAVTFVAAIIFLLWLFH